MRIHRTIFVLVLLLASSASFAADAPKKKYEYAIVSYFLDLDKKNFWEGTIAIPLGTSVNDALNLMGKDGWELVVIHLEDGRNPRSTYYLKREK